MNTQQNKVGIWLRLCSFFIVMVMTSGWGLAQSNDNGFVWGVVGHPQAGDYKVWDPASVSTTLDYIQKLGCKYYRCSFDYYTDAQVNLGTIVPAAKARGITILPIVPAQLDGTKDFQYNYDTNYTIAYNHAKFAIDNLYGITYWELGNEMENYPGVSVNYDGSRETDYISNTGYPYGIEAVQGAAFGMYWGIKAAYDDGRAAGKTTIVPQTLLGTGFRHWGLLKKIQNTNNWNFLPCDIIAWHWYNPSHGKFNAAINDPLSASNGRYPIDCLNDFKKADGTPKDIWITELGREEKVNGYNLVGSCVWYVNPEAANNQNWPLHASNLESGISDLKGYSNVKAIFVYELIDSAATFSASDDATRASTVFHGLVSYLNAGILKDAFYSFRNKISEYGSLNPFQNYAEYTLTPRSVGSGVLEVLNSSTTSGATLQVTSASLGNNQSWTIVQDGVDANNVLVYKIINKNSGLVLGITNTADLSPVYQISDSGTLANRRWYVYRLDDVAGYYRISPMADYNKALHCNGTSLGSAPIIYTYGGTSWTGQHWKLQYVEQVQASLLSVTSSSPAKVVWKDATGESGYSIERKTGSGGTYVEVGTTAPNVTTFWDTSVVSATSYTYRIKTLSRGVGYSNEMSVTTPTFATLLSENFNATATGAMPTGWTKATPINTTLSVQTFPTSANKSIKLYDNSTAGLCDTEKTFTSSTDWTFANFSFYASANGATFQLRSGSTVAVDLLLKNGNLVYRNAAGAEVNVMPYTVNTWYGLKVVPSVSLKTFDLYVGGALKVKDGPLRNAVTMIDRISFGTDLAQKSTLYIDDILIQK
jgi:hypothetical protein